MMERFTAWLYEAQSARRREVAVEVDPSGMVHIDDSVAGMWGAISVSDRIGDIPRRLTLPDGRVVESLANDAIDRLEAVLRPRRTAALLHRLERHWRWASAAVIAAAIIGWLSIGYGVPWAARIIAFALPDGILAVTGKQTLAMIDQFALSFSHLSEQRRDEIEVLLSRAGAAAAGGNHYRLALRDGGRIGANAFALPDGTIVITDQLVKLAENDEQIIAVLAHEIGHVQLRHGMQRIVQSSAVSAIALFVLGDVSQVISTIPTLLLVSAYSRNFEREADAFSVDLLRSMAVSPANLASFLERMQEKQKDEMVPGWLSTHPSTPERVQMIEGLTK